MSADRRPLIYLAVIITTLVAAMALMVNTQRDAAADAAARQDAATALTSEAFELDSALRGFLLTGSIADLRPYREERERFAVKLATARRALAGDAQSLRLLNRAGVAIRRWETLAAVRIATMPPGRPAAVNVPDGAARRDALTDFREQIASLDQRLGERRDSDLTNAGLIATVIMALLVALLSSAGYAAIRRGSRLRESAIAEELEFRHAQREFTDVIQSATAEGEAGWVLKRHLERMLGDVVVTVLQSDHSGEGLAALTAVPDDSPLAPGLARAQARDCMALRTAQRHQDGVDAESLLSCRICGQVPGRSDCRPLLVSGQAIGSVVIEHHDGRVPADDRIVSESVGRAAPMLANLRAIAVAEAHAATDALTALPNRRTLTETLRRMAAQASRSVQPLAALVLDIDWFKSINDKYGHDVGDDVLAAVADVLREGIRDSDVAGRLGGEEFVVLAPDTSLEGAEILAEKLREAIALIRVDGVDESITASIGVAVLPDDAATGDQLMRRADRALYLAKELGRNRVALGRSLPE